MGKLIVFPATLLAGAVWLNLPPLVTVCLVVFGALPTAVSAYPFVQQMGGNAKLMADIITLQTLASLVGLTIWTSVAIQVSGFSL
jgi:predicted permease